MRSERMINTYNESHLHYTLKQKFAPPYAQMEAQIGPYIVDVVYGDRIVEIQTQNLRSAQKKLLYLLDRYWVKIVHPIITAKWLCLLDPQDTLISRRKSPKKGTCFDLFHEIIYFPNTFLNHARFSMEIAMVQVEEIRRDDGKGSHRRKGISILDRKCLKIEQTFPLYDNEDIFRLIAPHLAQQFTTQEMSLQMGIPSQLSQKIAWWLRTNDWVRCIGKKGRYHLYQTNIPHGPTVQ